jgi:hypothetical protein
MELRKKCLYFKEEMQKKNLATFKQCFWNKIIGSYPTIWTNELANPIKDTNNKDWDWVAMYLNFVTNSCLIFHTSNNFKPMVDSTKGNNNVDS